MVGLLKLLRYNDAPLFTHSLFYLDMISERGGQECFGVPDVLEVCLYYKYRVMSYFEFGNMHICAGGSLHLFDKLTIPTVFCVIINNFSIFSISAKSEPFHFE